MRGHCPFTGLLLAECDCGGCDDAGDLAYDASSGGLAVDIGDGMAIDTADGDLAVDIGGVAFDI